MLEELENEEEGKVAGGGAKMKKKTDYLQALFDICSCKCPSRDRTLVNVLKKERYLLGSGTFWLIREMTEIK